jgi:type IV secretory pathway TrbL component
MEDLIKDIQQRTGLPADKVLEVVTMVTDYLRNALPDDLVRQVTAYLGSAAEAAGSAAGSARATASSATSGATSGAAGVAGWAASVASTGIDAARKTLADIAGDTSPANDSDT